MSVEALMQQDFTVKPNSSIFDYLDPSILEDDVVLGEIKSRLRKGHLVVLKDAFVPEFAEYVWKDLARQEDISIGRRFSSDSARSKKMHAKLSFNFLGDDDEQIGDSPTRFAAFFSNHIAKVVGRRCL
jgi:hypothetical protein